MAKPTATAAATALPPRLRMAAPIRAARLSCATTMPCRAVTACTGGNSVRRCGCAKARASAATSSRLAMNARRVARIIPGNLLVVFKELLHHLEQHLPVLLQHEMVRALRQHNEPFARRICQERE